MLEFLIALFGGAYWAAKISGDKAKSKAYDQRFRNRSLWQNNRRIAWEAQVCDRTLKEDLSRFISDPHNYEAVWKEIRHAYSNMPSYKSFTKILLNEPMVVAYYGKARYTKKQRENIANNSRDDALDIMLAHRGKVRGPQVSYMDTIRTVPLGSGQDTKAFWDMEYEIVIYLRDALRENGVDARPIFMTGLFCAEDKSIAYDLKDIDRFHYKAGRFVWLPVTYFDNDLRYIGV